MDTQRWQRIKTLLDGCADLDSEARARWLDDACDDPSLRAEVESFLAFEDDIDEFENAAADDLLDALEPTPTDDGDNEIGELIGPYRVEALLGRGGMGAVYRARREAEFEQRVALKLVRSGYETADNTKRFHTERQILASLEHPHIARLLDGGTSEGRSYFAMELIDGVPIDRYCDENRLDVWQRVELILQVTEALSFAHRNLVLHLDLKPSNILVTADGSSKLLDFGIGKLLARAHQSIDDTGSRRMTLRYASPEQVSGEPMSTSSDLYSLGVVLYELLTARLPCAAYAKNTTSMMLAICNDPPGIPSAVVRQSEVVGFADQTDEIEPETVARTRAPSPTALSRRLNGDLDAILLRALAKEPSARYASVEQLAADLRRHLEDRPVLARGDGLPYRTFKLIRRQRWAIGVATVFLALVLGFTVALADQLRSTERERSRATQLSDFLVDLFRAAEPDRAGEQPSVRELVDLGRERLNTELEDEPEVRAQLLGTLGQVYYRLGFFDAARESQQVALDTLRREIGDDRADIAKIFNDLAVTAYSQGRHDLAENYARQSIAMRLRLGLDEELQKPRNTLASVLMLQGKLDEATTLYEEILHQRRQTLGQRHRNVSVTLRNLGNAHYLAGDFDAAEAALREALDIRIEHFGRESTAVATVLATLGRVAHARGELDAAERLYT
ncbi:MAG: serine/threonine-protein kinase, partial [Acidobacteriota bacterium]